ncbi:MAG: phosphatase PAP2 family protein [Candidatus Neomarinimicrobiota bacterium]
MLALLVNIDKNLFLFFNSTLIHPVLDWIMPIVTNQFLWAGPLIIGSAWLILRGGRRGRITLVILIITLALSDYSVVEILKPVFARLRPYWALDEFRLLVKKGGQYGLPSAHASSSFAIAVILTYFYKRWKYTFYFLAALVAYSRVYVGVHFPGDIVLGALYGYGLAWAVLSIWVILKVREQKRGKTWIIY